MEVVEVEDMRQEDLFDMVGAENSDGDDGGGDDVEDDNEWVIVDRLGGVAVDEPKASWRGEAVAEVDEDFCIVCPLRTAR